MKTLITTAVATVALALTACGTHDQESTAETETSVNASPAPETSDFNTYDVRVDVLASNYGFKWFRNVKCPPVVVWQPGETFTCTGLSKLSGLINEKITVYMLSEVGDYRWEHHR